jgi:hypothetical protein
MSTQRTKSVGAIFTEIVLTRQPANIPYLVE